MKRIFDILVSLIGLIILSPIIITFTILIWLQDYKNPFYISKRVGKRGKEFMMIKLRSMVVKASLSGVDSTGANDPRITKIGHIIRRYKIDELSQLINVFIGTMSFVGPRPNVKRETDLYTNLEMDLLNSKPGITDLASIVFSDEGDILKDKEDPDLSYNQLIRPTKSRLGLLYIKKQNFYLDIIIILITLISLFSRSLGLKVLCRVLNSIGASEQLIKISSRRFPLIISAPPGSEEIVNSR